VQLGPLEVGVLLATVMALYVLGRHTELAEVIGETVHSFAGALRGSDRTGPTPT